MHTYNKERETVKSFTSYVDPQDGTNINSAKKNAPVCNVELIHNIEIWLVTKIVGIIVLTPSEQ